VRDGARPAEEALGQVATTIAQLAKVSPLAATRLMQMWGMPAEALPLFIRGAEALERQREAADRLSGSRRNQLDAAERLTEAEGKITLAATGLRNELVTRFEPAITGTLTGLTNWIERNTRTETSIKAITTAAELLAGTALFRMLFGHGALGAAVGGALRLGGGAPAALASNPMLSYAVISRICMPPFQSLRYMIPSGWTLMSQLCGASALPGRGSRMRAGGGAT
jgi:hypothetical protein